MPTYPKVMNNTSGRKKAPHEHSNSQNICKIASSKLSNGDIRGAIRMLSSGNSILPFSNDTLKSLQSKHPEKPVDLDLPDGPSNTDRNFCTFISRADLRKCILSFKNGSGAGHDGILPDHLKDLTSNQLGLCANDLLDNLCTLFNEIILPGNIPYEVCPLFLDQS